MHRVLTLFIVCILVSVQPGFCTPQSVKLRKQSDLDKALFEAVEGNRSTEVNDLLARGASVNAHTKKGWSVLMHAANRGETSMVELLLKRRADVRWHAQNGNTALTVAIYSTSPKAATVQTLIAYGADVNVHSSFEGNTPLMLALYPYYPNVDDKVRKERQTIFHLLLDKGADPHARDREGKTVLMYAVTSESIENVNLLLDRGVDVNVRDRKGLTALLCADHSYLWDYTKIAQALLKRGAEVNVHSRKGKTPLMMAVYSYRPYYPDFLALVQELLKHGADVNARDAAGRTALFYALEQLETSDDSMVNALLAGGADVKVRDRAGITVLMEAARYGWKNLVQNLLKQGMEVNVRDRLGRTALIHLGGQKPEDISAILRMLIEQGADIQARDSRGRTLLFAAAAEMKDRNRGVLYGLRFPQLLAAVDALVERGVEVNARNREGETVLILASMLSSPWIMYGSQLPLEDLLKQGADPNARDRRGFSALTWAAFKGDEEHIKLLQAKGAKTDLLEAIMLGAKETALKALAKERNIDRRGPQGQTALIMAAAKGDPEIVHALLERGAEVNAEDSLHFTPLHFASGVGMSGYGQTWYRGKREGEAEPIDMAEPRHLEIIRDLLAHGADIDVLSEAYSIPGDSGRTYVSEKTPLECAMNRDSPTMVRILLEHGAEVRENSDRQMLEWAISQNSPVIVKLLLERGTDVTGMTGSQALEWAEEEGRTEIVVLLKKAGAKKQ